MRHNRQPTDVQRYIGRIIHHHKIGNVVNEGALLAHPFAQLRDPLVQSHHGLLAPADGGTSLGR
jgi:hypothetical protein